MTNSALKSIDELLKEIDTAKDCVELSAMSKLFFKGYKKYSIADNKLFLAAFRSKANAIFATQLSEILERNPRLLDYGIIGQLARITFGKLKTFQKFDNQ